MQHDVVEQVIKAAGRREQPPPEIERTIHDSLRQEWLAVVADGRRRRRRATAALAALFAAGAVGVWIAVPQLADPGRPVATVAAVFGELSAKSGWLDSADAIRQGNVLKAGDALSSGHAGRAALTLASGLSARLDHRTRVRLVSANRIVIERGALYIDGGSAPRPSRAFFEVVTPAGIVTHVGTQYEIRLARGDVWVRVREGRVELRSAAGHVMHGKTGELLVIGDDGRVSRQSIPTYGRSWDWVAAAAPGLDIDGLPLSEFLSWVSRELGCEIAFATPSLAAEAARIELRGSIEGLTPVEALKAVLGTTRLSATIANGRIDVSGAASTNS